ncbi:tRNA (guanine-N(7))-methyltransferase subunit TRM82 [Ceratobasidium sp. AG-Ba]|nr:tRNA (guanine-N(7))-methyltransferase subunit TRM82 [Ceratobasidium sp. AG-Ba]QRW03132.1 tRNA (guanine-N(7))-methyltransferase subunit TRM82 [Ceratobasidium sp. AG-Ba]
MSLEPDQISPFSHIFISTEKTVAISGHTVFVLNHSRRPEDSLSSTKIGSSDKNASAFIRVAAVDKTAKHLVISGDDKRLRVWNLETMEELSSREIPKRANVLKLTKDGQTILAADKFGDIFSYPLTPKETKPVISTQPATTASTSRSISTAMHDNPEGTLILGHTSIVTALALTLDEKLIVSADRDEHVRVSWYPDGWDVEKYCMGHKKFISALEIPACAPHILISGGGDPDLYVWDYRAGGRKKWKDNGEGKRPSKNKKGKGKPENEAETSEAMDTSPDKPELAGAAFDEEVLVISHISDSQIGDKHVVFFSAVGASALFYFEWPASLDFTGVLVKATELSNPVTEFGVLSDGDVWVSVDPCWSINPGAVQATSPVDSRRIIRLAWSDGNLMESARDEGPLKLLNENCVVKVSTKDIQALNLYDALIALPKISEPEDADGGDTEDTGTPVPSDITSGPGLRASARQRTKAQLEKRKSAAQETSEEQRSAKHVKVDDA